MNRFLFVLFLALILFLTACGETQESENDNPDSEEQPEEVEKTESKKEAEDGELTEIGQKIDDPNTGSTIELIAMKEINETIDLNPIKLTIDDIKIISMSDIKNNDFKSYISQFTDKEEFEYIQIKYSMENTVEENIELYTPIKYLVLNTGEQIDVMVKDIMLDPNNGGDFFGKVTKETGISAIIEDSDVNNIESIKLITGDVWEKNGERLIGEVEKSYDIK